MREILLVFALFMALKLSNGQAYGGKMMKIDDCFSLYQNDLYFVLVSEVKSFINRTSSRSVDHVLSKFS